MIKRSLITGASLAGLAVILGAFGAHALELHVQNGELTPHDLDVWDTGTRYQFYHAFALIAIGILARLFGETRLLKAASVLFTAGVVLFSGSLYLLSTRGITGITANWIGPITPFGGLCFITAWIMVVISFIKNKQA